MKHLKKFNEIKMFGDSDSDDDGPMVPSSWKEGLDDEPESNIEDIVDFINPADPMMSDEYYYYCWGDDEAYYAKDLKPSDYLEIIEATVFKEDSNTAKKFGYDYIMVNKDEILGRCKTILEDMFHNSK